MLPRGRKKSVHECAEGTNKSEVVSPATQSCIIHKEQAHSIKKCLPSKEADNAPKLRIQRSWLLHFTRKFNLAILSRFPGSRLIAPLSFSCYGTMDLRDLLLCYSDRIAQVSHLIPSFCTALSRGIST